MLAMAERPKQPPDAALEVEAWLESETFHCLHLRCNLQPQACVDRQKRKPVVRWRHGKRYWLNGSTADRFCSGGKCAQGKAVRVQLKAKGRVIG